MRAKNMQGKQYGELTAIRPIGAVSKSRNIKWEFLCSCGRPCEIDGYAVRSGKVTTCQACAAKRTAAASIKHGMTKTVEFSTWTDIQTRCHNPNSSSYHNYGGRGIVVCSRWRESFQNFLDDMGLRPSNKHSIDRINVNGNYEPENCRWATRTEQARNRRNNRMITIDGETKTMQEWANQAGISASTIYLRSKAGITGRALILPSERCGAVRFKGITDTYAGWSKRTGIKKSTIAMRLTKYGWPIDRALTEGASL